MAISNYRYHTSRRKPIKTFLSIWMIGLIFISVGLYFDPKSQLYVFLLVAYALVGVPVLINVITG